MPDRSLALHIMLSPEKKSYKNEPIDPVVLALSRRPFRWGEVGSYEIPLSLHCLGERELAGAMERSPIPLETGMSWFPMFEGGDLIHLHVSICFVHRTLEQKSASYDEVEGQYLLRSYGLLFNLDDFSAFVRKDVNGLLPRLVIDRTPDGTFRVYYRIRPDFSRMFANLLGECILLYSTRSLLTLYRAWY